MKLNDLIDRLLQLQKELGNVEVEIANIEDGNNATDRYGIGMGLKVGDIEVKELQNYEYK